MKQVWAGNPAKFVRKITEDEMTFISQSANNYHNLAQVHATENDKKIDEIEFGKVLHKKYTLKNEEYNSMIDAVRETMPELVSSNVTK